MDIKEIDMKTKEGILLLAAIGRLMGSKGNTKKTAEDILKELEGV